MPSLNQQRTPYGTKGFILPVNKDHEPPADTASINRQIATLCGWTDLRLSANASPSVWRGKPPGRYRYYDVPDYCADYGAALSLLETVCREHDLYVNLMAYSFRKWTVRISLLSRQKHEIECTEYTLPLAISLASRDALLALKGDTDDGTN